MLMRTFLYWVLVFLALVVAIAMAMIIIHWSIDTRL
jgi:hypothetical protein